MSVASVHRYMAQVLSRFGPVVIAGGAIRDEQVGREPKDFDVYVLGTTANQREAIKAELAIAMPERRLREDWEKSTPDTFHVATIDGLTPLTDGLKVQIMITPHVTVDSLLASFDWSICGFAYDGQHHQHPKAQLPEKGIYLELINGLEYPISSLRRGFRFSERYGMKLHINDLTSLCAAVVVQARARTMEE